jgi:hypothetical protein
MVFPAACRSGSSWYGVVGAITTKRTATADFPIPSGAGERQAGEHEHIEEGGAHPVIPIWCPACSAASDLDQLPFRSPSAWLLSLLNRPSGPSELRIALNSDRRTASWLIVPSRYMSSAFQSFPDCRIK